MTFDNHWTKVLSFNPALAENPFLRPLAEAAWNAAAVAEREACAKVCRDLADGCRQIRGWASPEMMQAYEYAEADGFWSEDGLGAAMSDMAVI